MVSAYKERGYLEDSAAQAGAWSCISFYPPQNIDDRLVSKIQGEAEGGITCAKMPTDVKLQQSDGG